MIKTNTPEIGKTYAFFDDGKTGLSRRYKALVRIYLDNGFYKDFSKDWWWEEEK